jgi:thiamine kinase-like enzyme
LDLEGRDCGAKENGGNARCKGYKICFTHGDASSSNILVRNGRVVALIDFEMSGFYPEYWEYTTAMNVNRFDSFWKGETGKFSIAYPRELEMETLCRKYFGPGELQRRFKWHSRVSDVDKPQHAIPRIEATWFSYQYIFKSALVTYCLILYCV